MEKKLFFQLKALYKIKISEKAIDQLSELLLDEGDDTPSSAAFHKTDNVVACGINSSKENIEIGKNYNCRIFEYSSNRIELKNKVQTITSTNLEDDIRQRVSTFSEDGKFLAVGSTDGKLTVLKYPSLQVAFPSVRFHQQELYDANFNSNGSQIVVVSNKTMRIFSTENGNCIYEIENPVFQKTTQCQFRACRFGKKSSEGFLYTVVNVSRSKAFIVKWNADTCERIFSKVVSRKPITAFAISENGNLLSFATSDSTVRISDAITLRVLVTIPDLHKFPTTSLTFNHDSSLLVSGSVDATIQIIKVPEKFDSGYIQVLLIFIGILLAILAIFYQIYFK
ncbi:368_t:CDS:10 [Entrophospora sp. SA101]|nr:368_t:CDS:10 [Entrophospora sp. SA101]